MKKWKTIFLVLLLAITTTVYAWEYAKDPIIMGTEGIYTDSRGYATLTAAIAGIGGLERDLYIARSETVGTLTIPSNVRLHFLKLGAISVTTQLNMNTTSIFAGDKREIFTGVGDIDFVAGSVVRSAWFDDLDEALDVTSDDTLTMVISRAETTDDNMAVGNNVTLRWESPIIITVDAGDTISNLKHIEAGTYQIFTGAGDLDFLTGSIVHSSWFVRIRSADAYTDDENVELTILVDQTETVDASFTFDSYQTLEILRSNIVTVASGQVLTIDGPFEAGLYQTFSHDDGDGIVISANSVSEAYPQWWGAVGDDTVDNYTMFEAAIAAGPSVFVHKGTYKITDQIDIDVDDRKITGVPGAIIKQYTAANQAFLISSNNITIRDLEFVGPNTVPASAAQWESAIHHDNRTKSGLYIENCYFEGFNYRTIVSLAERTQVIGNEIKGYGTFLAGDPPNRSAIQLYNAWSTARDNHIYDWDYGINAQTDVSLNYGTVISGNKLDMPDHYKTMIYTAAVFDVVVSNNTMSILAADLTGTAEGTIKISTTTGAVVSGNMIQNGIILVNRSTDVAVTGNSIYNDETSQIMPNGMLQVYNQASAGNVSERVTVSGNNIICASGCKTDRGIFVTNAWDVIVSGNLVHGVYNDGIVISGTDNTDYAKNVSIIGNSVYNWGVEDDTDYAAIVVKNYNSGDIIIKGNTLADRIAGRANFGIGISLASSHTTDPEYHVWGNTYESTDSYLFITVSGTDYTFLHTDQYAESLTADGAITPTIRDTKLRHAAVALAMTLANGVHAGQEKYIYVEDGVVGNAVTPATFDAGTAITFNSQYSSALLRWIVGSWQVVSTHGNVDYDTTESKLTGSDTWDPGNILAGAEEAKEVTVTGAAAGDFAIGAFSIDVTDLVLQCSITAGNTATCMLANNTGGAIDLGSGTIYVRVVER